jgi:hypothetical protein
MWSAFILAILVSLVIVSADPKELSFEEFRSLKVAKTNSTGSAPTQYLVTSLFTDKTSCSGSAYQAMGIGFGTCMTGSGYSISYTSPSQDSTNIKYTMNYYASNDCTGPTTYSIPTTYAFICYPGSLYGIKYSLVTSATPWETLGEGIVNQ